MTPPIKHSTGFKLKWHPVDDQMDLRRLEEDSVPDWNASQLIRLDQIHELIIYRYGDGTGRKLKSKTPSHALLKCTRCPVRCCTVAIIGEER